MTGRRRNLTRPHALLLAGPAPRHQNHAVKLRPFIGAGWAHQVSVAGGAGAVDVEVEPGFGESEVAVEGIGRRVAVPASLTVVGPVADRAGGTASSVATARTSRQCLLTHAGKPSTSTSQATGLSADATISGWDRVVVRLDPDGRLGVAADKQRTARAASTSTPSCNGWSTVDCRLRVKDGSGSGPCFGFRW
jgi:hypothetical protein